METIVFASGNKHKVEEVKEILSDKNIITMAEIGFNDDIVEDGKTFEENALIKARAISEFIKKQGLDYKVLSDDTGLCIDALNGAPGVYSARYAGNHDSRANRVKILRELENASTREANFTCVVVLYSVDGTYKVGVGKTFGEITKEEIGDTSFGYDAIFYSHDLKKTFGQATSEEKNSVSHRGRALRNLFEME